MNSSDVIIIGAGAAGVMAARELSKSGLSVTVLEAKERSGGRIYTLENEFSSIIEGGAEFVHGKLPLTLELLKEAGIEIIPVEGDAWQSKEGSLSKMESFIEGWPILIQKLKELKSDISIKEFLDLNFSEPKYESVKESITSFVEGYDAADPSDASTVSLREEWLQENENEQFRIKGGYGSLIKFLVNSSKDFKTHYYFNSPVTSIEWQKGKVKVATSTNQIYQAKKALITVPLGVLKRIDLPGSLTLVPNIPTYRSAANEIGFGAVIKIVIEFKEAFWNDIPVGQNDSLKNIGFLFSKVIVPTWWTQHPVQSNVLTGWLAGPKSKEFTQSSEEEIIELAMTALSSIFPIDKALLQEKIKVAKVFNWNNDPFTQGGYGYAKLKTKEAKKLLNTPIEDTMYFAGEALYEGPETGTVEAGLATGMNAAKRMMDK